MTYQKPEIIAQEKDQRSYVASCYRPQLNDCCGFTLYKG